MLKKLIFLISFIPMLFSDQIAFCISVDSSSFKLVNRFSFYSYEKNGEFLLHVPSEMLMNTLSLSIKIDGKIIASWSGKPGRKILRVPFLLYLTPSEYKITADILIPSRPGISYYATTDLIILNYKPNEVKTDRFTGGLIVNRRQFFPFGFYCYSPVYPTLPEEEVVKGFNMISPYQKILPETLNERKAYMDRCAELGMKVHFNLLSVSGGGGVGSRIENLAIDEKRSRLVAEIKTFMNHPALLGWYISDEPNGHKIAPEELEEIYRTVKEYDPWHPASMVFTAPFLSSRKYVNALDIVMADPYPVPDYPISMISDVTGQLGSEFAGKRPVWMVLQTFGGGELWSREPTLQEIRSMTWQAIIKGASGIQYFVRQGLNYFPKSSPTWGECGRMAMEVAELTPWLLSDEETLPVQSSTASAILASKLHKGQLLIMAVNKRNEPSEVKINITGVTNGKARLVFENRSIPVTGGLIEDYLAPLGSQVYLINIKPEKPDLTVSPVNLIKDPGFEDISSPGIPASCYARPGGDRGATYFVDSREHHDGNHSLRLITPQDEKSVSLRFFPIGVKSGASYSISVWAKSDPEQRLFSVTNKEDILPGDKNQLPQYIEISFGDFGRARFIPDQEWRRYVTFVAIPPDTLSSFKTNLILKMPGQGVAWFDQLKVFEEKP